MEVLIFMDEIKIPTMLTINQAAERTGLPKTFIRQLIWDRKIVYIRSGQKYLVNLEKLCDFLNTPEPM